MAMEEDVEFRRSLPRNYLSFMGLAFEDEVMRRKCRYVKLITILNYKHHLALFMYLHVLLNASISPLLIAFNLIHFRKPTIPKGKNFLEN